ncbi:MAG: SGNH/GDSL hydrolase family protein [Legionella sp.]|nr:SGNH/GDSL hydrolase family protein [Legionella sp.]
MKRLLLLGVLLFSGFVYASPIHNIVVFGDSLSDNGNLFAHMEEQLPPSPPYYDGRFSNGPVWVEYLTRFLLPKQPGHMLNYAFGGAMVSSEEVGDSALFTIDGQVQTYLTDYPNDVEIQDNLYIFWIGSNNYLGTPEDKDHTLAAEVTQGILKNLELLANKGAKNILILNIPNIGNTPFARFLDEVSCSEDSKTCKSEVLSYLSNEHNKALAQGLNILKMAYPNVNLISYDINQLLAEVISNPALYQFSNVTEACNKPEQGKQLHKPILSLVTDRLHKTTEESCDDYLFFDLLHPTTKAHRIISGKVATVLQEAGIEISNTISPR